jgi:hypothetical protein
MPPDNSLPLKDLQCVKYDRTSERGMDRPSIDRRLQLNRHEISYVIAVAPIGMLSSDVIQLSVFEVTQSHPAKCKDSYRQASARIWETIEDFRHFSPPLAMVKYLTARETDL